MRRLVQLTLLLSLSLLVPHVTRAEKRLSIKSEPVGARVHIGKVGQVEAGTLIGVTPILSALEDYWFEGPTNTEIQFLAEPIVMSVSKEGYETKTELITKGPFEWVSADGTEKKHYYVLISNDLNIKLDAATSSPTLLGPPQPPFTPPIDATWYRRALEEVNSKARSKLEKVLSAKGTETNAEVLFADSVVCGPLLWERLRSQAGKELQESLQVSFIMSIPRKVTREGRNFSKPIQKQLFWNLFMDGIKGKSSTLVRRASKPELEYYWSTISFNIEEPLFVVDIGELKVLMCFVVKEGETRLFWMDIVGDLGPRTNAR